MMKDEKLELQQLVYDMCTDERHFTAADYRRLRKLLRKYEGIKALGDLIMSKQPADGPPPRRFNYVRYICDKLVTGW